MTNTSKYIVTEISYCNKEPAEEKIFDTLEDAFDYYLELKNYYIDRFFNLKKQGKSKKYIYGFLSNAYELYLQEITLDDINCIDSCTPIILCNLKEFNNFDNYSAKINSSDVIIQGYDIEKLDKMDDCTAVLCLESGADYYDFELYQ